MTETVSEINNLFEKISIENVDENVDEVSLLLNCKKKKKKVINHIIENDDYTYTDLLTRFYKLNNLIENVKEEKKKIPFPKIAKISNKIIFLNFSDVCSKLNRNLQHVANFISLELNTVVSLNLENSLIIRGKYNINNIQTILSKYISCYVKCYNCKDMSTQLLKDSNNRLYYINCDSCLSKRYIYLKDM